MDWTSVLGWGSPIGLGVFFGGLGFFFRGLMKKGHHWDKSK